MEFMELAKSRYSCREMTQEPVRREQIEKILETALSAPTAVNHQPYKIFWLDSPAAKENLKKAARRTFGADTFLLVGCKEEEAWVREYDKMNFAQVDGSIVATHIMMEIADLGLATTWVGHFDAPMLKEMYPQMKDYDLIALFPIGYAAPDSAPSPRHTEKKPREEVVEIL